MNHFTYKPRTGLRPAELEDFSEEQLEQHWALYEGYVENVNLLNERLGGFSKRQDFGPDFAELKRRLGFEYDGMVLHEHYFSVLRKGQEVPGHGSALTKAFKTSFGGYDAWKREFMAMGKMRGVGWVILYHDPLYGQLANHWIGLHEVGHPAGFQPLLVMDVWEHAYMIDWGASGRAAYLDAFFKNVDWPQVERHLALASTRNAVLPAGA